LEADHIKPWAYFPSLRFELSNGRTLCRPCHDKTKMDWKTMRTLYAQENAA
jgi:5-methylcytosine-specific restriction endonuclease McrA